MATIWRFRLLVGVFLLPFALALPYRWFVFESSASGRIVTMRLEQEHRQVHLAVFWFLTWCGFAGTCFLAAAIILAYMTKHRGIAQFLLAMIVLVVASILLVLMLSD